MRRQAEIKLWIIVIGFLVSLFSIGYSSDVREIEMTDENFAPTKIEEVSKEEEKDGFDGTVGSFWLWISFSLISELIHIIHITFCGKAGFKTAHKIIHKKRAGSL